MAILSITLTSSDRQLISGIPQFVVVTTNIPSIIFYTLDGTIPTTSSRVYVNSIEMPGDVSVRLRIFAKSGILVTYADVIYSTDSTLIYSARRTSRTGLGILVDGYNIPDILSDGFGLDDDNKTTIPLRSYDQELVDYDIKYSRTGPNGEDGGTFVSIGYPDPEFLEEQYSAVEESPSSPNNNNVNFNPRALYIYIDGRDGYANQSVLIINRPYGSTMDLSKYSNGSSLYNPHPYISGGLLRPMYNLDRKESYFPYWDSNELRWVISHQKFNPPDVQTIGQINQFGQPLCFKWIYNKRSTI